MHNIEINIINLKNRTERWTKVEKVFKNFKINRFEGITHKDGWIGCSLSHINIVKNAKKENKEYVIVSEDDTYFIFDDWEDKFFKILEYLNNHLNEWNLFNFSTTLPTEKPNQKVKLIDTELKIIEYEFAHIANFIIYHKSSYDTILGLENNFTVAHKTCLDVYFNILKHKWTLIPGIAYQHDTYSDITKYITNYSHHYETADNFYKRKLNII